MDEDIIKALAEAGSGGLALQKIVLYAYNGQNSLFRKHDKEEVRGHVMRYLRQNSRYPGSLIQRISKGIYRLNPNSDQGRQLLLSFEEQEQKQKPTTAALDENPDRTLFDDLL